MNSGGRITLNEPLSLDELQTGALVLRVSRNGAPPVDATLVVTLRSASEIGSAGFYAYGTQVLQVGSGGDLQRGDFTVNVVDRSASWQVVGFRVDRQYWHGGFLEEAFVWRSASWGVPAAGEECVALCTITVDDRPQNVNVSLYDASILGADWSEVGGGQFAARVSSGTASISDGVQFDRSRFSLGIPVIKAIPRFVDNQVSLAILYPYGINELLSIPILSADGTQVLSPATPGPYFMGEI